MIKKGFEKGTCKPKKVKHAGRSGKMVTQRKKGERPTTKSQKRRGKAWKFKKLNFRKKSHKPKKPRKEKILGKKATVKVKKAAMSIPRTDLLEGRVVGCQRVKPTGASQDFACRTPGLITRSQSRNRADLVGRTSWHPVGGKKAAKAAAKNTGSERRQQQKATASEKSGRTSQKRKRRSWKKAAEGSKSAAKLRKGNEGSSGGKAAEGSEGHRGPKAAEGSGGPKAAEGSKKGKGRKAVAKEDRRRKVFRFVVGESRKG